MQSSSTEPELFPLSYISQYGYCPRRCALLGIEQEWRENAETAAGRYEHDRVHNARTEQRGGIVFIYELSVYSERLCVNGKCDLIEAHPDEKGVLLPFAAGRFSLYPIEYKHGVVRKEEEYQMQLCAQAMCLEEMFGCTVADGALFFIDAHRRDEVHLSEALRQKTADTAAAVARLLSQQTLPAAEYSAKCKRCSMTSVCQPKLKRSAKAYCGALWEEAMSEVEQ